VGTVTLPFNGEGKIGYVVRYKGGHNEDPLENGGHSDCILTRGAPVGYFGGGIVNAVGKVFTYSNFQAARPHYVNLPDARAEPCKSTILVMDVGKQRAELFQRAWISMRAKTDGFTILGNNCSTHASRACFEAGVIRSPEISNFDTPNNLYQQIIRDNLVPWRSYSGYLDFTPTSDGTDEMMLSYMVLLDATVIPTVGGPRKMS
jgi:hypothetical protein